MRVARPRKCSKQEEIVEKLSQVEAKIQEFNPTEQNTSELNDLLASRESYLIRLKELRKNQERQRKFRDSRRISDLASLQTLLHLISGNESTLVQFCNQHVRLFEMDTISKLLMLRAMYTRIAEDFGQRVAENNVMEFVCSNTKS
jgi:hypothetical protein